MYRLRIKKEKKLIGNKFRNYIDLIILACCSIIAFNIHPLNGNNNFSDNEQSKSSTNITEKSKMLYVFHDYEGDEYIMNNIHGSTDSWDYLFNDEIPETLKLDDKESIKSVSLGNYQLSDTNQTGVNSDSIKDNQVSLNDIMSDLGLSPIDDGSNSDTLVIDLGNYVLDTNSGNSIYIIEENTGKDDSVLIIKKINNTEEYENNENDENITENENGLLVAKAFTFIKQGWILPTLIPRNDLYFGDSSSSSLGYVNNFGKDEGNADKKTGITIIENYAGCMTPWGYKIMHGESVLAYKQMDNAPNICNIERRFCWKGKLSGTYTQQGCSVNENYTYEQRGEAKITPTNADDDFKGNVKQNEDGSVTVKNSEIGGSFVFDKPVNSYTDFHFDENIKSEDQETNQTEKPHWDCTTPRGEKVKHGDFVQAFKHANGFNDAPCEAQIRLCSMGELMGTFKESTCKTWNTSFIDWVNGSPNWGTYSKEKIELIKKQIKNERIDYEKSRKDAKRSTDSDALDNILWILDQD